MPRNRDVARQKILNTVGDLFFRDGYRAVGVDTVAAKSGVSKMTLYHHFRSKDELIVAYLEDANAKFWVWLEGAMERAGTPREKLVSLFAAVGKLATSRACFGCAFQSTAVEFPELRHPGHKVAVAHKRAVRKRMRDLAKLSGARQPGVLADQLLLLMDGAFVASRMFGVQNHAMEVADAAKTLIDAQL